MASESLVLRTACNRDCPDACEVLATVRDGQIVRLQGAPDHPVTQGFLCERTSRFVERQYSPDRLTAPLRRVGDTFQPVGWDEALDAIAAQLLRIRAESGASAIMHYRCGGSLGLMKHVTDHFFRQLGSVTEKSGDVCSGAGEAAQLTDFGVCDSNDLFDLRHSRTIVLWGKNPYVSNVHLLPILQRAQAAGAQVVLIDPVRHRTAKRCQLVLQPRPGGDAALAMGVARWLLDHDAHDSAAPDYCDHWPDYVALVRSRSAEQWADAAGVPLLDLNALARLYAAGPAAILVGWGMQRRKHGAATVRSLDALAAMSGNLGISGGGVSFYFKRRGAFDFTFAEADPRPARTLPEPLLGEAILAANDPPIRALWISCANPVVMLPDSQQVDRALRTRELTVVVDSFLTDTARCANFVLPTTTFLEENDLIGAYGHHWIANLAPVVSPPAEVRSDYAILQALAPRLGLGPQFQDSVATWKARLLSRVTQAGIQPEQLAAAAQRNPFAAAVLFEQRRFETASGRVNLIRALPEELCEPPAATPLLLAALSTAPIQGSQSTSSQQASLPTARLHSRTAGALQTGDEAELQSDVGRMRVRIERDDDVHPSLVVVAKGGWLHRGHCANSLIRGELTDAGLGANYYDTPVRIEPIRAT